MGIEDLANQAKNLFEENKDKVEEVIHSEQAEGVSDGILDNLAGLANKLTDGKFADQIDDVRENIDGAVGNQ
ncbi:MAG TPA: Rv0909 family putative TA system antitoxin [Candidatus Lumbricidophila sp.]|nr:Rv0909 family putative TA system antitoxin [Candidatus Lumbricidophila sp.]